MSEVKKHKPHTHKGKKGKKGLKGVGAAKLAAAKKNATASKLVKPFGVITGFVGSAALGYALDLVPFLRTKEAQDAYDAAKKAGKTTSEALEAAKDADASVKGMKVKHFIKPIILLGSGVALSYATHNKKGNAAEFANGAGYGLMAGGAVSGVSVVTGKSLVIGLGGVDDSIGKTARHEIDYYKAQAKDAQALLEKSKWNNGLPQEEKPTQERIEGPVNGMGAAENIYSTDDLPL